MPTLLLEASHPFTGDMLVGLLCDLGVKPSTFEWELGKVDLGAFHLHFEKREVTGVRGVHFGIHAGAVHTHDQDDDEGTAYEAPAHSHDDEDADDEHAHHHHHDDHEDREKEGEFTAAQVRERLGASELDDVLKTRVLAVFDGFCAREAQALKVAAHDLTFDADSVLSVGAQIVCACVGLTELGVDSVGTTQTVEDSVAAAILAVYLSADEAAGAPSTAKAGCGIGDESWLRGSIT